MSEFLLRECCSRTIRRQSFCSRPLTVRLFVLSVCCHYFCKWNRCCRYLSTARLSAVTTFSVGVFLSNFFLSDFFSSKFHVAFSPSDLWMSDSLFRSFCDLLTVELWSVDFLKFFFGSSTFWRILLYKFLMLSDFLPTDFPSKTFFPLGFLATIFLTYDFSPSDFLT